MESKTYGNRRSEEELMKLTIENQKQLYKLEEQPDFKGTPEQLEMMQAFERAYIDGYPKISDEEWEILKYKFNYKESLVATAPSGRTWVKLLAPLPSINKAATIEDIKAFCNKFPGEEFIYEPKLDGVTANLRYVLDDFTNETCYKLDCITSRGNGRYGLKLNEYALSGVKLNGVPKYISINYIKKICGYLPKYFEIRGEAVINKSEKNIKKYAKDHDINNTIAEPIVWRSIVAGIFNRKVPANLEGVIKYLYNMTLDELIRNKGFYSYEENDWIYVEDNIENARLIASLGNDNHKFLRTSSLYIRKDGLICIKHADGEDYCFYDDGEELDIVTFSCTIDGVNKDIEELKDIPDLIFISNIIQYPENKPTDFYGKTKNIDEIVSKICKFYGCNENGKRDYKINRYRNTHQYALDGIVIKLANTSKETQNLDIRNSKSNNNKLVIPKYPADQIACKFLSEVVWVTLKKIEKTETELGNVTCQGILDKPYQTESGAWVETINLHNERWLTENDWIKEGGTYPMVMAMDIIPTLMNPEFFK